MAALNVMDDASIAQVGIVIVSGFCFCFLGSSSEEIIRELLEEDDFFCKSFFESKVPGESSSHVPLTISCSDSSWSEDLRREKRSEARDLRRFPKPAGRLAERDTLDALRRNPPEALSPAEARSPPDALSDGMALSEEE